MSVELESLLVSPDTSIRDVMARIDGAGIGLALVVDTQGLEVVAISEKPLLRYFVNAGIYLLSPEACRFVPADQAHDMTDLVARLIAEGRRVISFPIREYWLDIGEPATYEQAQQDVRADSG